MPTKQNLLVTLSNKDYLEQAKQVLSSAYWNAGWKGDYMLLAHNVPDEDLEWFRQKGILITKVDSFPANGAGSWVNSYSPTVNCKLFLFTKEFKSWKRVIYLDADCIVRYPLDGLVNTKHFSAVSDWLTTPTINGQAGKPHGMDLLEYESLFDEFNMASTAFNTGVFSFNTDIIEMDTLSKLQQISLKYDKVSVLPDQLWLNLFFYKKWERLPMEYNLFASYLNTTLQIPKKYIDGVVLHFPRFDKVLRCWQPGGPFYEEWEQNLRRAEEIDLENIPDPCGTWPGLSHRFSWRLKIAMRGEYVRLIRNRVMMRRLFRKFTSLLKKGMRG